MNIHFFFTHLNKSSEKEILNANIGWFFKNFSFISKNILSFYDFKWQKLLKSTLEFLFKKCKYILSYVILHFIQIKWMFFYKKNIIFLSQEIISKLYFLEGQNFETNTCVVPEKSVTEFLWSYDFNKILSELDSSLYLDKVQYMALFRKKCNSEQVIFNIENFFSVSSFLMQLCN